MMRGFDDGARFVDVHRELAERVIARDATARAMLAEHLQSTLHFVYPAEEGNKL
jgi:DNA-binding GntR family transcriptional regulator